MWLITSLFYLMIDLSPGKRKWNETVKGPTFQEDSGVKNAEW